MQWLSGVRARLSSLLLRGTSEARADEEFEFHIAMQAEKHVARGMTPESARRQALLEFGGLDSHRETMRDGRRPRVLAEFRQDASFTLRSLRNSPAFTITAVFVIALGVGATTSLFSLANALLFRALPVAAPGELYMLQEARSAGATSSGPEGVRIPYPRYESYRDATAGMVSGLAAHAFRPFALRTETGAQPIEGAVTSANYFELLGLQPAFGRFYTREDEPVAVLSHRLWRTRYDADPSVIGGVIHLDGTAYSIVAIAPRGFDGTTTGLATSVWLPFHAPGSIDRWADDQRVGMIARVPDRAAAVNATAQLTSIATAIPAEHASVVVDRAYFAPLTGLPEGARGGVLGFMGMLLAAAFLVLLIAAANVAALLLARSVTRQREMALRLALGAGRWRLIRQLLTESTTLFVVGGAGGIALAYAATALLARVTVPGTPILLKAAPDLRVLAFGLAVAAITGLVFGVAPAVRATRASLVTSLREGAASGATARARGRSIFAATQVALATVLLITAGLFVRGLQHGLSQDPGFRPDGVVVGTIDLEPHGLDEAAGRAFQAELIQRVSALPEVESAAYASTVLASGNSNTTRIQTIDADPASLTAGMNVVDASYFETLDMSLVRGRSFTHADVEASPRVVVVNETLAARMWPGEDALGQRLQRGSITYEVVGIARNGRYVDVSEEAQPFAFFAASQHYQPQLTMHVRGRADAAALLHAVRSELRALDPDIALQMAMPLTSMMAVPLIPQRFAAGLVGVFGALGLILAGAGVYGVMSYQVAQRQREFGVRLAFGARARDLLRLVVGRGAIISATGALVGIAIAVAVTRLLTGMLFGLSPLDPVTFGGVALTLVAVTALASWVPARRALRVDPMVSLRHD